MLALVAFTCSAMFAQNNTDELISQYSKDKHVQYLRVPQFLLKAALTKLKSADAIELAQQVKGVRILMLDNCGRHKRNSFRKDVNNLLTKGYQEFAKLKDADNDILVLAKGDEKLITEIGVLMTGEKGCKFAQITGEMNPKDISAMVETVMDMQDITNVATTQRRKFYGGIPLDVSANGDVVMEQRRRFYVNISMDVSVNVDITTI